MLELPEIPAEEVQDNSNQNAELEEAKQLINEYCLEVFDQEADYSDLSHVDLAYSATSDSAHTVEIFRIWSFLLRKHPYKFYLKIVSKKLLRDDL